MTEKQREDYDIFPCSLYMFVQGMGDNEIFVCNDDGSGGLNVGEAVALRKADFENLQSKARAFDYGISAILSMQPHFNSPMPHVEALLDKVQAISKLNQEHIKLKDDCLNTSLKLIAANATANTVHSKLSNIAISQGWGADLSSSEIIERINALISKSVY